MEDWQEMLKKRRAVRTPGRKQGARPAAQAGSKAPAWKVTKQLRGSYYKPADNAPTRIRVIPNTDGSLFYEYYSGWVKRNGRNSPIISNAWNGDREIPCLLFDKYSEVYEQDGWEVAKAYKADRKFAMTIVVLEHFYVEEVTKGSNTYTNYIQAPAPDRHGNVVDDPRYANCEKVFGRVLHWSMYNKQKEAFEKNLRDKLSTCVSCKEGQVEAVAFSCEECGHVFADVRTANISPEERQFLSSGKKVVCDSCEHQGVPVVERECVVQKGYGSSARFEKGCDNPTTVDAGRPIDLVIRKVPIGNSFGIDILDIDIPQNYDELPTMQENPQIRTDMPLDYDRFFGRMSLRDQAFALFGSADANPYDDSMEEVIDNFFKAKADEEDLDSIPF